MLCIQQQGRVDVNLDANLITFSNGNSSITQIVLCFNILLEPLLIEPILRLPDHMDYKCQEWQDQNNEMHLDDSCFQKLSCPACVPNVWSLVLIYPSVQDRSDLE